MGEDSLLTLFLKVEGGQASAAEIDDLKGRLTQLDKETTSSQDNLKDKFSQKFEHIALRGFLADGMRAIGIGGEMRPVLNVLQMSLMGVIGAMNLWAVGLAAVAGLLYTIYEHTKKHNEALSETAKKQQEAVGTTEGLLDKLTAYQDVVKKLPKNLDDLKTATQNLKAVQEAQSENTEKQLLEQANKRLISLKEELPLIERHNALWAGLTAEQVKGRMTQAGLIEQQTYFKKQLDEINAKIAEADSEVKTHTSNLIALHKGYANVTDALDRQTEASKKAAEAEKKLIEEHKKYEAEADKELRALEQLNAAGAQEVAKRRQYAAEEKQITGDLFASKIAAVTSWVEKEKAAENKHYAEELARLRQANMQTEQLARAHQGVLDQIDATGNAKKLEAISRLVGLEQPYWQSMEMAGMNAARTIERGFSDSMAKILVEGGSFQKEFAHIMTQVTEQIISDLIRIQIEAAITKAIMASVI